MAKKATNIPTQIEAENERLNARQWARMFENALLPNIHATIAPALLGSPTLPLRSYASCRAANDDFNERYSEVWQTPKPSIAGRTIALLSSVSVRSTTVSPDTDRVVMTESLHEFEYWMVCQVDRRVSEIMEQPAPPLPVLDKAGKWTTHHFDFLVIMKNGRRIAVAVKPEDHREKADEAVAYCNQFHRGKLADHYVVRTRADMSRRAVANAGLILWARRLREEEHVTRMDAIASQIPGIFSMDLLWAKFGAADEAFVAAINLIDQGKLRQAAPGLIEPGIKLEYVSSLEAAA
jgi:hypothetical protein